MILTLLMYVVVQFPLKNEAMCGCFVKFIGDVCVENFDNDKPVKSSDNTIDDLVYHFSNLLQDGEFWLSFKIINSPGDGHCLIHSFVTCFNHLGYKTDNISILKMLVTECTTNSERYLTRYIGAQIVYITN